MIHTYHTHLISKTNLTPDIMLLKFGLDEPGEVDFLPGQYLIIFVPQEGKDSARRLFSFVSSPHEKNTFELLAEIFPGGVASEYFLAMQENEKALFQGPAGRFVLEETLRDKVFLATGTGIAPMLSIFRSVFSPHNAQRITHNYFLYWGVPTFKDVYFLNELKRLTKTNPHFHFCICVSRETSLDVIPEEDRKYFTLGRITVPLAERITHNPPDDFYICGNRDMVDSVKNYLLEKGIGSSHIFFEKF